MLLRNPHQIPLWMRSCRITCIPPKNHLKLRLLIHLLKPQILLGSTATETPIGTFTTAQYISLASPTLFAVLVKVTSQTKHHWYWRIIQLRLCSTSHTQTINWTSRNYLHLCIVMPKSTKIRYVVMWKHAIHARRWLTSHCDPTDQQSSWSII